MLRKHSAVIHLAPDKVMRYVWTHKDYQPWGTKLAAQCLWCGSLNPWEIVSVGNGNYGAECKNLRCRGGDSGKPYSFPISRRAGGELLTSSGHGSWLKEPFI